MKRRARIAATMLGLAGGMAVRAPAAEWIELTAPKFTIVSDAPEAKTRAWAVEFERFRRGMEQLLPLDSRNLEPVAIVLFRGDREFKAFKPLEHGKPSWIGGYFVRKPGKNLMALSVTGPRWDTRRRIFHEATHWYLSAAEHPVPLWLDEGLAEVFSTATIDGDKFTVGASRFEYVRLLRSGGLMSFAKLAAVRGGSLNFNGRHAMETTEFYAQSWETAHMLLLGEGNLSRFRLQVFLRGAPVHREPVEDFALFFGRAEGTMDADVAGYLQQRLIKTLTVTVANKVAAADFAVKAATPADVDLALGNLLVGAGRAPEARPYFERTIAARPDDPEPRVGLGEVEWQAGRPAAALDRFREAFARGGQSFAGRFLATMAALQGNDASPVGGFGGPDYAVAVENLTAALRINPRFRAGYQLAGTLMAFVSSAEIARLEPLMTEASRRYVSGPGVEVGLGIIAVRKGDLAAAREHAQRAAEAEPDPALPIAVARRRLEQQIARADAGRLTR